MEDLLKQAYDLFVDLISKGMCILPPDNNFLFYEQYDFSKLGDHRDEQNNTIGQWQSKDPISIGYPECNEGKTWKIDFGDSAHKTGILAFCNSEIDKVNLHLYEKSDMQGHMVRHPYQPPWNNWKNCTRDQLLAYAAGCWRTGKHDIVKRLLDEHNKRTNVVGLPLCQNSERDCPGTTKPEGNTDILAPHHVMFLRICAGDFEAYKDPIGQLALQMDIEVTDKNYKSEKNQLILMSIVCGRLDLYVHVHDNWRENIMHYWDNKSNDNDSKRDQGQIGEAFIKVVEYELKRYSGQLPPSTLGLPVETLKILLSSEYFQIFLLGNVTLLPEFINRLITALSSDIQKIAKEVESYISNAFKNPINILNVPFMPFNPVAQLINNLFNETDLSEVYYRLNEIQKEIINLTNMVEELHDDIYAIPEKVAAFNATLGLNNDIQQFEINSQSYSEELNSNNKDNLDKLKSDFKKLGDKMLDNFINYSSLNKSYPYAPFVIACMNIHLSCLAMAGEIPSRIKAILEKQYKPWLIETLEDKSNISLSTVLSSLQNRQNINKLSIPPLYTLQFTFTEYYPDREYLNDGSQSFIDYIYIKGTVKKNDYSLVNLLDKQKIESLQPIINNEIISEHDLPELVVETLVENNTFSQKAKRGGFMLKGDKLEIPITFENYEAKISILPMEVFVLCSKIPKNESAAYPAYNLAAYNLLKSEIITVGETIIRHGTIKYNCQLALEKIAEVITTLNDLKK